MSKPIAEAKFYAMTAEAAVKNLQSDAGRGLSGSEAKKRLSIYGENRLQKGKKTSFAKEIYAAVRRFYGAHSAHRVGSVVCRLVHAGGSESGRPAADFGHRHCERVRRHGAGGEGRTGVGSVAHAFAPHADVLRDGQTPRSFPPKHSCRGTSYISARET